MNAAQPRDRILEALRAHQAELTGMGARHLALFGSRARGDARPESDIDIGVEFDASARADALAYFGVRQRLEDRLSALLSAKVELSDVDMQRPQVRRNFSQDRIYAF